MSRDKQNEIHELAKQMSEAISTEVEQKYIMEEAKLEAVLRANGWVKAEEIFAEIEKTAIQRFAELNSDISRTPEHDKSMFLLGEIKMLQNAFDFIAELKKKYTEGGK